MDPMNLDSRVLRENPKTLEDFVLHLVRLGCEGKGRDVEMLGRRMVRRLGGEHPRLAERLAEVLEPFADPNAVLR
jgi:hypothetical protein